MRLGTWNIVYPKTRRPSRELADQYIIHRTPPGGLEKHLFPASRFSAVCLTECQRAAQRRCFYIWHNALALLGCALHGRAVNRPTGDVPLVFQRSPTVIRPSQALHDVLREYQTIRMPQSFRTATYRTTTVLAGRACRYTKPDQLLSSRLNCPFNGAHRFVRYIHLQRK